MEIYKKWLFTYEVVVNTPPPPNPAICNNINDDKTWSAPSPTNLAAMRVSIRVDSPHARVPTPVKITAVWFAPLRPNTLLRRPYNGVNVHIANRYLRMCGRVNKKPTEWTTYDVPSQLAWFDLLNSEDMEGSTFMHDALILSHQIERHEWV